MSMRVSTNYISILLTKYVCIVADIEGKGKKKGMKPSKKSKENDAPDMAMPPA